MASEEGKKPQVDETRRAMIAALGTAPVILTLIPGRARAEYRNNEYFEGSCEAPPPHSSSDVCGNPDPGGG